MTRALATAAALAACAALVLGGCAPQDGDHAAGERVAAATSGAAPDAGDPGPASTGAVKAAGLDPCPRTDGDTAAREDGLPDIELPCLGAGPPVRLAALRGTPLVVNVWASWCQPCRNELPVLAAVAATAKDRVQFLGIDVQDTVPDDALGLLAASGVRFPSVVDYDKASQPGLRWVGPPMTVLVRADGSIAYRHAGELTSVAQLRDLLHDHLGLDLA